MRRVLKANEQIVDGTCERCGTEVEEKHLTQWFLKITNYAERLLYGLDKLPWREEIKEAQRAWIGKSEGAYLDFQITGREEKIKIFTTRPDTLFGATYVVLAPEHALVQALLAAVSNKKEVEGYVSATAKKTERERSESREKTGVKLEGVMAINPATNEEVPVYVADYVLGSYGTGAVMAVPAHDERDFEFAQKYNLSVRYVIDPVTGDLQENPKEKNKIVAVVEDGDKVLTILWRPDQGGRLLIGGTAEEGEDLVTTATREIAEETGYNNLELVERAEETVHHSYFAHNKNVATLAHSTLLYFRLKNNERSEPKLADNEVGWFTVEWISKGQAMQEIKDPLHQRALERFLGKGWYVGNGTLARSGDFNGKDNEEAKWDIVAFAGGEKATQYRLRDWSVSRQRYWGCPIPIVYDPEGKPHTVPAEHLPWLLPTDVDFKPTGKASPLASSKELQERVTRLFGEGWTPEYDTLDTFVDSSWYFARYLDPKDEQQFSDPAMMQKWLPVHRYSGGSEHTTMHLLYARFFTMALFDLALVPIGEPFSERFNRGIILGPDGAKMSKSKGNVINPDDFVQKFGADAVRIYLAFIGPYNEPGSYPWNLDGVASMRKFLDRVDRVAERTKDDAKTSPALEKALAVASIKVSGDGDRFKFNTGVAGLMTALNEFEAAEVIPKNIFKTYLILLAPFAPHLAEHLWERLGGEGSVHEQPWPELVVEAAVEAEVVVQVNGKRRGTVTLAVDAGEVEALAAAREVPTVAAAIGDKEAKRVIYVPGRILNVVV